jgi:fructose-bisphosphate aldolase, class I
MDLSVLTQTIAAITARGKGLLAADESAGTVKKRFDTIDLKSTDDSRRAYRELFFTTPTIEECVSGVILFEETLHQKSSTGVPFPKLLAEKNIIPGIKVDKGLIPLVNGCDEQTTQGLDGLPERLEEYKKLGARFAKWRAVYRISDNTPSALAIHTNAHSLASYAAICQSNGIVPIVEPEVLITGKHTIEQCAIVTENVLFAVFCALRQHGVALEGMILKPSMVISGSECPQQASPQQVADETLKVFRRVVPGAVPTINFLSGGQAPEQATLHLSLMNKVKNPWPLSFSYARALQAPALKIWKGKAGNVEAAQAIFLKRARLNSAASLGEYSEDMG